MIAVALNQKNKKQKTKKKKRKIKKVRKDTKDQEKKNVHNIKVFTTSLFNIIISVVFFVGFGLKLAPFSLLFFFHHYLLFLRFLAPAR